MMGNLFERAATIALAIFDLSADFTQRFAFPCHVARSEMPLRVARHAGGLEIGLLMTAGAPHRRQTMSIRTTLDRRLVGPTLLALTRMVAARLTVHAAG